MEMLVHDGERTIAIRPSKIVCLLRNYAEHAKEMNNPVPDRVRFFLKPPSSLVGPGGSIVIPEEVKELHHEVELGVIVSKGGKNIPTSEAGDHILGYILMLDLTARDLQDEAKSKGLPWAQAKGFDTFAPYGQRLARWGPGEWSDRRIYLSVNGTLKQDVNTSQMVFGVERVLGSISRSMTLEEGDLILTGTPAGVGRLCPGDRIVAGIEGSGEAEFVVHRQM